MTFQEPTFEDYKKATAFARFKYKYGIIILVLCWLCLLLLIYFVFSYGEEISRNPFIYATEKAGVECICSNYDNPYGPIRFYVNSTTIKELNPNF